MLPALFFLVFSSEDQGMAEQRGRRSMARHRGKGAKTRVQKPRVSRTRERKSTSSYFTQPGKRGVVVVLRKPCGNRISPKVCGMMPTRAHAKMLITQLEKAESVVNDLFLEATDDGIEALEAVLAACCDEVLRRGPGGDRRGQRVSDQVPAMANADEPEDPAAD
jgi:hypothetical protein